MCRSDRCWGDERCELLQVRRIWSESTDSVAMHLANHRLVDGGWDSQASSCIHHIPVQLVDLGPPPAHDVLKQRRPTTSQADGAGGHSRLETIEPTSITCIHETLGLDPKNRLDLVPGRAPNSDYLGSDVDSDPPRYRL